GAEPENHLLKSQLRLGDHLVHAPKLRQFVREHRRPLVVALLNRGDYLAKEKGVSVTQLHHRAVESRHHRLNLPRGLIQPRFQWSWIVESSPESLAQTRPLLWIPVACKL